jgi:hypothetical protein
MNKTVEKIGKINFEGNIIPRSWYKHITFKSGKPNLNAIIILSEIINDLLHNKEKNEIQRSYQSFADKFGISKRQVQNAIKSLINLNLITIEFKTIVTDTGIKISNAMFIKLIPEKIKKITYDNF